MLRLPQRTVLLLAVLAPALLAPPLVANGQEDTPTSALAKALTFHAAFDGGVDADFALGDARLYTTATGQPSDGKVGLSQEGVVIAEGKGRHGDALQFTRKALARIYFKAERNVDFRTRDWSGTVSFWLSLDPQKDLEPGFSDPIQITDDAWNKSALWVDFSKDEVPRHFRYGVFADFEVWNPPKLEFDDIPPSDRPWIVVTRPPFERGRWTHVAMTFSGFNNGDDKGVAALYLDGELKGELRRRRQTFTWELPRTVLFLGLSYIGLMDDLACFRRALGKTEIKALMELPGGVGTLAPKREHGERSS